MTLMLRIAFLLSFAAISLAQTAPPEIGTGSISGKVTVEGKPAPGVTVIFQKSNEQWDANKPGAAATTDAEGIFKLDKLRPAQYYITASTPGFYNPQKKSEWDHGIVINLGDGEQATGVDFALRRGAVVTGRLFDANGRGVIEQQVVLKKIGASDKRQLITCSEMSDDRGIYRCYGLEPGKYIVGAGADPKERGLPLMGTRSYVRAWYPGVAQEENATPIEIMAEKETTGIDLKLERKKKGFKVMGRVFDADSGKPVPNIMLGLGLVNEQGVITGMSYGGGSISNAEGEFKIEGITKGKYRAIPNAMVSGGHFGDGVMFEVDNEDVSGIEVKMHKGATIQGTVALEEGAPPEAHKKLATIILFASSRDPNAKDSDWYASSNSMSGVDAAGNVQFKGIRTGRVTLSLDAKGGKGFSIARVERDGVPIGQGFEVKGGEQISGLRIVLAQGSATIRGEIKVEGGTLPEDVFMRIRAKATNTTQNDGYGNVDARGRFLIENLSSGSYDLMVDTFANRPPYNKPSVTLQSNSKTVQVTNGQETTVTLTVTIGSKDASKEKEQ